MLGDKLKKLLPKKEEEKEKEEIIGNDKKKIENLVFFVVLLIITILIINFIWNDNKNGDKEETTNDISKKLATSENINQEIAETNKIDTNSLNNTENLENKLKNILSKIQGVGEVDVCLNYSESSEVVAMYNENSKSTSTEETDDTGGTRKIEETDSQKEVIYKEDDGVKTPITAKIIKPKIEGAIITAKGVENADVKTNVIQAVEAVTGLATHKIQVLVSK